ncbi:MAG: hypothetical protein WKF66_01300 [Pedobacter sp.]
MFKTIRIFSLLLLFAAIPFFLQAQDAVVISEGNFLRGTIKGTSLSTVVLKKEDEAIVMFKAKDIKEFLWNGETFASKPIVIGKNLEYRFFKVIELGAVNLYAIGGEVPVEEPVQKRAKIRPSFGIGGGTGGFGGVGMGAGISLGGGRNNATLPSKAVMPITYFIEKFGTGPMQEILVDNGSAAARTPVIKSILLQKLTGDDALSNKIKATEVMDAKLLVSLISAYNAGKK